jgi:tyrosinase
VGGLLLLFRASGSAQSTSTKVYGSPIYGRPCAQFTRKNIKNLTATELTALKNGVQVMKARSLANPNDPTGWIYQANIHGTSDTPVQTAWNTCQHTSGGGGLFFLSWHRMYLHFFERILRAASGSPTLALPYWNYFDAAARQIPLAYRSPANASNPLWVSTRGATMGAGGSLPASAVNHATAFSYVPFNSFSSSLEGTPHNVVHTTIGGWMLTFQFAGRDPVFWLHHCNIDRLWNRWLSQGGGRTNPVGDPSWMNTVFTFFDETGTQVQMSGSQVVSTASQLKYCYDEERQVAIAERRLPTKKWLREVLAASSTVELSAKTARIVLTLNEKARSEITKAIAKAVADAESPQFVLDLEGAEGKAPEGYFEVYFNLPEGIRNPDYRSPHYAGNLSFFGLDSEHRGQGHEKLPFRLIVTNQLRTLSARRLLSGNTLALTFVGRGAISAQGRQLPLASDARVRVERVTLSIEK